MGQGLYRKSFFSFAPLLSCQYLDAFARRSLTKKW